MENYRDQKKSVQENDEIELILLEEKKVSWAAQNIDFEGAS